MTDKHESTSKFLSLVLRHQPEAIGLTLDEAGWAPLDELVRLSARHGKTLSRGLIAEVVSQSEKQRFALSEDGERIRANQGHSVRVDVGLAEASPPARLFHGTATRFLLSIREGGLLSGSRQHVHLSPDTDTATAVGARHGKVVVLEVDSGRMSAEGHRFWLSENGVWLCAAVPARYLAFPAGA